MNYSSYGYHCSKHVTKPRDSACNIKGVELEISDYDSGWLLDELIEEGIITVPYNEDETNNGLVISCEHDSTVFRELIFKASCNQRLFEGVKTLSDKLHGRIDNGHSTSCHIHINNKYLDSIGVRKTSIIKSAEFLSPILFKISGRNENAIRDWCKSIIRNLDLDDEDLLKRAERVDNIPDDQDERGDRYCIINTTGRNTTELRLFSNYYGFDYKYIKMYIECVDFIIELAQYMQDKSYVDEFNNVINMAKIFFGKRKYKEISERHNLNRFFMSKEERKIAIFNEEINFIKERFGNLKVNGSFLRLNNQDKAIEILRILRGFSNRYSTPKVRFNILDINLEEIENNLVRSLEEEKEEAERILKEQ